MANNKFGGINMQQMIRQAQKAQEKLLKAKEELENMEIDGIAGEGLVTVTLTGKKRLVRVHIDPKAVDIDDLEMLEDLIVVAYNYAAEEADKAAEELMPEGMGDLL